ncbi:hypothetical protein HWV62_4369 [Athelia sp. TMB]|nr:hypothetical protein HWV62_4369 [Athelia sp. TMB]
MSITGLGWYPSESGSNALIFATPNGTAFGESCARRGRAAGGGGKRAARSEQRGRSGNGWPAPDAAQARQCASQNRNAKRPRASQGTIPKSEFHSTEPAGGKEPNRPLVLPGQTQPIPCQSQRHIPCNCWAKVNRTAQQALAKIAGRKSLLPTGSTANIHLTPEKPEYSGGTWHVEGQLNEHICATALYYYDSSNITESRLAFRQQSNHETYDISYGQGEHGWLQDIFGCENEESSVQYVGDVVTKQGRLITFPNVFQHRVTPFSLADPTKPGHRKILALFLVDPHIQIISSAHVPCQRRDWWAEELGRSGALPGKLPLEIVQEVMENVEGFPISLGDAKQLRLELMEERKSHEEVLDGKFHQWTFSLCEH